MQETAVAGTKEVSEVTLLSRQFMQVTVPKDLPVIEDERLGISYENRNGDRHSVDHSEGLAERSRLTPACSLQKASSPGEYGTDSY